jgi:hypothetical protein
MGLQDYAIIPEELLFYFKKYYLIFKTKFGHAAQVVEHLPTSAFD